jgi:ketosteroid isomerase-like protein
MSGSARRGVGPHAIHGVGDCSGDVEAVSVGVPGELIPEAIIGTWVDAFNARDLDGMLACLARDVDFHPLRLSGIAASYHGHDGVRDWFAQVRHRDHAYQIVLRETRASDGGRVFASGALTLGAGGDLGPFCAVHRIDAGLIVAVHQYLSEAEMIEFLGLIP